MTDAPLEHGGPWPRRNARTHPPSDCFMPPRKGGVARIDGVAWILLVSGLLVALGVFGQEPDAPAVRTANLLGRPGSWLAYELFQTLGLGVYVLLATWFVL